MRSKDRIQFEWLLATSRAGVSWILATVTKCALEREFHDHSKKVSCDVECWFLYVCDVGLRFRFIKNGSKWRKQILDKIIAITVQIGRASPDYYLNCIPLSPSTNHNRLTKLKENENPAKRTCKILYCPVKEHISLYWLCENFNCWLIV